MIGYPSLEEVGVRARAAFLGLALGDALGATVEFMTRSEIQATYRVHRDIVGGGWLNLKRGRVTDDTEMSICIARAVDTAGGWDLRGVAEAFATWLKSGPIDAGNAVRRGLRRYITEGSLAGLPNEGDGGNGAAMRMTPVAIFTLGDRELLERLAVEQAHVTHHHRYSDAACVLIGELIHLACGGAPKSQLRAAAERFVERWPTFRFIPYGGLATGYVVDTLQTVLHCFFTTDNFEDCLVSVVNQGGDADTTGAIAGALAGAFYGPDEIPSRWVKRLDAGIRAEVERLADRLLMLSPLGRGQVRAA